jgi:hypothetical protein|uniref:Uncharacterized protein n=2 Tax=Picea TaxID=3328 RepID=A0A117NIW3_PICGL|nr:hypothetical protein ABT39_MTgene353 [Picea glauca]QHR90137.1 hypothetical protein Q903MT_gene4160 [Picea sitchensis]
MATEKFPIHDTDSTGQEDIFTEAMETEEEYFVSIITETATTPNGHSFPLSLGSHYSVSVPVWLITPRRSSCMIALQLESPFFTHAILNVLDELERRRPTFYYTKKLPSCGYAI